MLYSDKTAEVQSAQEQAQQEVKRVWAEVRQLQQKENEYKVRYFCFSEKNARHSYESDVVDDKLCLHLLPMETNFTENLSTTSFTEPANKNLLLK